MRSLSPQRPSRRRTIPAAAFLSGALATALTSAPPAYADPCSGRQGAGSFDCSKGVPGSSSNGGYIPGTDQGGTTGTIPTLTGANAGGFQVPTGGAAEPTPTSRDLAQLARDSAELPVPEVHTSPEGRTYVQVRTALWVEGFDTVHTDPINVADQSIQATATPKSVIWNLGATTVTCDGPGRPNDTTCSHTYQRSSAKEPGGAYRITATITWSLSWTCTGGGCDEGSGTMADMTTTSQPTPLVVDEIQTNAQP